MIELKPCPFCGGEPEIIRRSWDNWGHGPHDYSVQCKKCFAGVRLYYGERKDAIEAWNGRVGDTNA